MPSTFIGKPLILQVKVESMKVAEIRSKFLEFFQSHGHEIVASSSLIPEADPTLLFANAGMNQFKDMFLGREQRSYQKASSCQKCVRAGGKHNDLENVGYTARHHTFFEMLGNFSFGDYFKKTAIQLAWEFSTEVLGLKSADITVTVFETDTEARKLWLEISDLPEDRIISLGEADNFWSMGETGPCGPCSEMFFDRGEKYSCGAECGIGRCECDRYMEYWNLVFMQFDRNEAGDLTALPKPSVDTGMGLERMAGILQKTETNYEIDTFTAILDYVATLAGAEYDPQAKTAFNYRVIADHARSVSFLISDGVMPSNEGRGYVLRRIIRRAVRYGRNLGFAEPFLHKVCLQVIDQMAGAYPELKDKKAFVDKVVSAEEAQFFKTLERGLSLLDESLSALTKGDSLAGELAFKLYDTFGFPIDLTRVIAAEQGISVDEPGFEKAMAAQKTQSKRSWKKHSGDSSDALFHELANKGIKGEFAGHETMGLEAELLAIVSYRDDEVEILTTASDSAADYELVFAKTPFYPEGGGQVGDRGLIQGESCEAEVLGVRKAPGDVIAIQVALSSGELAIGQRYSQVTDHDLRLLTTKNHTATHLLHWALRETLGDHVKQAGSLVNEHGLRFDFSHFQALTASEIASIEARVNDKIWQSLPVNQQVMAKDEAIAAGAIAFFGDKYGDEVRVVAVGDFSVELCGGSHVANSAEINLFKIQTEASIAAGVRRITAVTSKAAFELLADTYRDVKSIKDDYKLTEVSEIGDRLAKLTAAEKDLRRKLAETAAQQILGEVEQAIAKADGSGAAKVIAFACPETEQGVKTLRDLADLLRAKHDNLVFLLGMQQKAAGKALLLCGKGAALPKSLKAGDLIKELAPYIDGRGGGKPDLAQAGGTKVAGVPAALDQFAALVQKKLGV